MNEGRYSGSRDTDLAFDRGWFAPPLDFARVLAGAAVALRRDSGFLSASTLATLGGLSEDPDVPKPLRDLSSGMDSGDSPVAIAPRTRGGAYYLPPRNPRKEVSSPVILRLRLITSNSPDSLG